MRQPSTDETRDELARLDPRFSPGHAAYYLSGLLEHTESRNLPLSLDGFPASYTDNRPLAFTLRRGMEERNIYIAADDMPELDAAALDWADVYGKVNLLSELVPPRHRRKVVAVGPSHGVRIWTGGQSLRIARATARAGGRLVGTREHYRQFWQQARRRVDASFYEPEPSEDAYVFHNSWLWAKHPEANPPRAEFIRACRLLSSLIEFEGGFIPRRRNDVPEYQDLVAGRRYSLPEYLENTKRSTVVFNNPAVHHCLGWKLAEYLRLGKAIISLPISRELPAPLLHGEHLHITDGDASSIQHAVRTIVADPEYRQHLERGARSYYLKHLTASGVIRSLATIAFSEAPADRPSNAP